MTPQEKARMLVEQRSIEQLIEDFETTNDQPMTEELPIVRGWLMDELESRNPEAFELWIDNCDADSPRQFFFPLCPARR